MFQNQLLRWATSATQDERMQFLKRYLDVLPEEELNQVPNLASKAKKRRKRARAVSAPDSSVSVPAKKWYEHYQECNIVSMDVEKVEVPRKGCPKKFDKLAGIVSIVDHKWNFKCKICQKNFFYNSYLKAHMLKSHKIVVENSEDANIGCVYCGSTFETFYDLRQHQKAEQ